MNEIFRGFTDADDKRFVGILLSAFCMTVPTFAFFFVAAGIIPLWMYVLIMFSDPFGFIIAGIHLVFYFVILYGCAEGLTWAIFKVVRKPTSRLAVLGTILLGLAFLALNPVYWPPSHSRTGWTNIFRVLSYGL